MLSGPSSGRPEDVLTWLQSEPPIEDLRESFPGEWDRVRREAAERNAVGDEALRDYVGAGLTPARSGRDRTRSKEVRVREEVRRRMLLEMLRQADLARETGISSGRVAFNRWNGVLAQRLFFAHDLVRKPVSMKAHRIVWPLLGQRRLLLPLVRRHGIYCFYSRAFVKVLAELAADRPILEIAAGDGTLTRFLREQGVNVRATDDYSWSHHVEFDQSVERMSAAKALRTYAPAVVVCSWPPPDNEFERAVFATPSVDLYVAIVSGTRGNAGAWHAYEEQADFEVVSDPSLSRLVLPSGLNEVLVFRRR